MPVLYAEYPGDFKKQLMHQLIGMGKPVIIITIAVFIVTILSLIFKIIFNKSGSKSISRQLDEFMREYKKKPISLDLLAPFILLLLLFVYATTLPVINAYKKDNLS